MHESFLRLVEASGGMNPADLARALNESPQTINNWSKRGVSKAGAFKAEMIFGCSSLWILSGAKLTTSSPQTQSMGDMAQSQSLGMSRQQAIADLPVRHDGLPPSRQTPVISWVQAGDYTEVLSGDLSHVIEWIPYNPKAGTHGFALIVKGRSMEPMFNPDDRIYINPTFQIDELHTGALVVMSCNGDEEATFKELVVEDGEYYLRPLNPNWHKQILPIDGNCRLVGKVVGKFVIYD